MIAPRFFAVVPLFVLCGAGSAALVTSNTVGPQERVRAIDAFQRAHPATGLYRTAGRITSVYGRAFSGGPSPQASAAAFLERHASMFGVVAADLVPGSLAGDGLAVREFVPDLEDGHLRFTLVAYLQARDEIPVFRGDIRLLVRNEEGFPLVLARSALRPLGGFVPDREVAAAPNVTAAFEQAIARYPGIGGFTGLQVMIWAGPRMSVPAAPALALVFQGSVGAAGDPGYQKWLLVADAATGQILHSESLIHSNDVTGSVKGMATQGKKADICAAEALMSMPYARVSIGSTVAYADAVGNFTIPNAGSSAVTVQSGVRGRWFRVFSGSSDPELLSQSVTPPGPASFVHNQPNTSATARSGVNAYIQANVVRDYTLQYSPTFPTIGSQTEFRVNINVSGTCNAFYDGSSINFYPAGGGCPSTAFADVVHHEYGHHLVDRAGAQQLAYGEGMGDVMGILISDEPILGYGFNSDCNAGIRSGANNKLYPCVGEIHDCGQLISGCVWSTRNQLINTNPSTHRAILSTLAINAMLLTEGGDINPSITIDYLTLDDDNADLNDGTPHYNEINAGFSAHNMPAPPLNLLAFTYPEGRPSHVSPRGGEAFTVAVSGVSATPEPDSGILYVDPENDGTYTQYAMTETSPNVYQAQFPPTLCGSVIRYYVSARTSSGATAYNPSTAPVAYYTLLSADSVATAFEDGFETDQGWTTAVSGAVAGLWQRDVPTGQGQRGDPATDFDGSGSCFLTQNGAPGSDSDVDGGSVILTSPTMNATGGAPYLSYARWYSNSFGSDPNNDTFLVEVSNDNGATWATLELVGPASEANGGWFSKTFPLSAVIAPTATMKVRYTARDLGSGSVVEAAVDAVKLEIAEWDLCPSDFNGDCFVDGIDYDQFNNAFEAGDPSADYNGDGFVDGIDYDQFNNAFETGC